jgi:hypothetical protein
VHQVSNSAISVLENVDTIGTRMTRIGRIFTDFFIFTYNFIFIFMLFQNKISIQPKKIRANPLNPRSNCIGIFQNGNCCFKLDAPFVPLIYFNYLGR